MTEFKVIGVRSMEYRSLNPETVVYERFEAMREARRFIAAGLSVVVLADEEKIVYTNDNYIDYLFSEPLPHEIVNGVYPFALYTPGIAVAGYDVATLSKIALDAPDHYYRLVERVVEVEQLGRETQSVPEYLSPQAVQWRLLNGYLQAHGVPVGTSWKCGYPEEMEEWLNAVFRYEPEDRQYFSFKDGVVTVIS